ncbi:MAG: DUF4390 domain-containing protein [Acidobacteria bacterium]|nr:DUF4390 domain-containing protein [Acidobacteriota bacterium]
MTSGRLLAIVLALLVLESADAPRSIDVSAVARDGRVYVSCTFAASTLDELGEAIHAGLTTSITYDVDLRRPLWWFDRTLASSTVVASVQHDTLTGRYQLTRTIDGRNEDTLVTDDQNAVKKFLTTFARLPLFSAVELEANVEYTVRLRVRTRPRVTWFVWPWEPSTATGTARFTFIP